MWGEVIFSHDFGKDEDWMRERDKPEEGTAVFMKIDNNSARTYKSVFDKYSSENSYGFAKTVVPVSLARYGNEQLVSRSQAKRLVARFDRFKVVMLDFSDVETIGQAFADEIFRVFKLKHPDVDLYFSHANDEVTNMIMRAIVVDD